MDTNEILDSGMSAGKLNINEQMMADLRITKKWTLVLAVLGFIFSALLLLGTLAGVMGLAATGSSGISSLVMMVVMLAIYIYPAWCLYQYSQNVKSALVGNNQQLLNTAFLYMKRYFKFLGIMMVCVLAFYFLILIFGGVATIF